MGFSVRCFRFFCNISVTFSVTVSEGTSWPTPIEAMFSLSLLVYFMGLTSSLLTSLQGLKETGRFCVSIKVGLAAKRQY